MCRIHTVMICIHKRTSQLATSFDTVGEEKGKDVIARNFTVTHISASIWPVKIHPRIANAYTERRNFVAGVRIRMHVENVDYPTAVPQTKTSPRVRKVG